MNRTLNIVLFTRRKPVMTDQNQLQIIIGRTVLHRTQLFFDNYLDAGRSKDPHFPHHCCTLLFFR